MWKSCWGFVGGFLRHFSYSFALFGSYIYMIKLPVCGFFFQVDRLSICKYSYALLDLSRFLLSWGNYSPFVISFLSWFFPFSVLHYCFRRALHQYIALSIFSLGIYLFSLGQEPIFLMLFLFPDNRPGTGRIPVPGIEN